MVVEALRKRQETRIPYPTGEKSAVGPAMDCQEERNAPERTVCVTGANGFIGSWVVSQLLRRGYFVHGTVRNPENNEKNGHLWKLDGAAERLKLYKAEILDYDAIAAAVAGCEGVFHTACPVIVEMTDPQKEMIDPAVKGVENVLEACAKAGVRRVVHTSSYLTCMYFGQDSSTVPDENCWADTDFYQSIGYWYTVGKVQGEKAGLELAEKRGIEMISVLPGITWGPMLQEQANMSSLLLYGLFVGMDEPYTYVYCGPVDVRDVAASMIFLYETPSASGRYICAESFSPWSEIMQTVAQMYPYNNIPQAEDTQPWLARCKSPSKRLAELGFVFRPASETLSVTLSELEKRGLIRKLISEDQGAVIEGSRPPLIPNKMGN